MFWLIFCASGQLQMRRWSMRTGIDQGNLRRTSHSTAGILPRPPKRQKAHRHHSLQHFTTEWLRDRRGIVGWLNCGPAVVQRPPAAISQPQSTTSIRDTRQYHPNRRLWSASIFPSAQLLGLRLFHDATLVLRDPTTQKGRIEEEFVHGFVREKVIECGEAATGGDDHVAAAGAFSTNAISRVDAGG